MAFGATANHDPDTGFAYGYIRADAIHPDLFDQLCYSHGKDLSYETAWEEYLARKRNEYLEAPGDEEFDEDGLRQQFSDDYYCEEPIYEGEHEGVKYRTSWLGGAQHLWVFRSPVLTKCSPCSPCVPGAGDLDSVGDYLAYGVPADWLDGRFLEEMSEKAGYRICDVVVPGETAEKHYWLPIDGEPHEHGEVFATEAEVWEDCYKVHLQHKVGLTLDEIKAAVDEGKKVHWANENYVVIKDRLGQYLILCEHNDYCTGLTHRDGVTMNEKPEKFYIG